MRYKEFNKKKVLDNCISLFWENSFNGTSINSIVGETRVNRFSLYHEFDNKQGILYESLKLYKERYSDELFKRLNSNAELDEILKAFYFSFLKRGNNPVGCFIVNIATELGDNDEHINAFLKSYLKDLEERFILLLNKYPKYKTEFQLIANNLVLLFCNAMCYCHIQEEEESQDFISLNLDLILKN